MVPEAKDHHYLQSRDRRCFNDGNASVYANIMKEWRILKKTLPESIYVQVYETRIDLLRAVIIGPAGTPYHDGLFFFDIVLPCDYPKQPPKVYYHSHGYRLNPNLYADGTLCLSLINTWSGSKAEKWSQGSTILQILVSIQGLVLNERPYFNEPGYRSRQNSTSSRWINASIDYNENVFILSCKTMIQIIRQPPENFENFVGQHFRARAASILAAIKHYQEGRVLVGRFQINAASSSSSSVRVSSKFKANLRNMQPKLNEAFASVISKPNKDKASASTSKRAKKVKKGRHDKDQSSIAKPQENVEKHETGIFNKLISFSKKIWK